MMTGWVHPRIDVSHVIQQALQVTEEIQEGETSEWDVCVATERLDDERMNHLGEEWVVFDRPTEEVYLP